MRPENISNDPRFTELLDLVRRKTEFSKVLVGKPQPIRQTREECIRLQQYAIDHPIYVTNYIAFADFWPPCITSFKDLKPLFLNELKMEIYHIGGYLLLRTFVPGIRTPWVGEITTFVEDENGDVQQIAIQHQEAENIRPAAEIIPEGRVLILKEPVFVHDKGARAVLLVNHLTNIIWLNSDDQRVPEAWRSKPENDEGNGYAYLS